MRLQRIDRNSWYLQGTAGDEGFHVDGIDVKCFVETLERFGFHARSEIFNAFRGAVARPFVALGFAQRIRHVLIVDGSAAHRTR